MTNSLLGFISALLELPGETAGRTDGTMVAALLTTLQATLNMIYSDAFNSELSLSHTRDIFWGFLAELKIVFCIIFLCELL